MENRPVPQVDREPSNPQPSGQARSTEQKRVFPTPAAGEHHLCVWGTQSSGKTTYLAMLYSDLVNTDTYDWHMQASESGPDSALTWVDSIRVKLRDLGEFPQATQTHNPRFMQFVFFNKHTRQEEFQFTFIEAGGEMYVNPEQFAQDNNYENPIHYLQRCSGLIMLLDPLRAMQRHFNEEFKAITHTLDRLGLDANGKPKNIEIPIAFCLTKCDDKDLQYLYDSPDPSSATEELAQQVFHEDLVNIIKYRIDNYRWFPLTALGFEKGLRPNLYYRYDGSKAVRDVEQLRPRNLGHPIQWLVDQIPGLHRHNR